MSCKVDSKKSRRASSSSPIRASSASLERKPDIFECSSDICPCCSLDSEENMPRVDENRKFEICPRDRSWDATCKKGELDIGASL